ncbi:MAG: WG repeat-containing protein [Defluviitaleaceae bacterium]|nr:WG repeat-containing protein [Defluviitaleaceae bacterium]
MKKALIAAVLAILVFAAAVRLGGMEEIESTSEAYTVVVQPQYAWVTPFFDGFAGAARASWLGIIEHVGVVDVYGNWHARLPSGGPRLPVTDTTEEAELMAVIVDGRVGFFDSGWNEVISPRFEINDVRNFSEGMAAVRSGDMWGYIDETGNEVISPRFEIAQDFYEGLAGVFVDGEWSFIDRTGMEVLRLNYNYAGVWPFFDGMSMVWTGTQIGYINRYGAVVIPIVYDSGNSFSGGFAAVMRGGKWGFIDTEGREVVPFRFELVMDVYERVAAVRYNGRWGFIRIN